MEALVITDFGVLPFILPAPIWEGNDDCRFGVTLRAIYVSPTQRRVVLQVNVTDENRTEFRLIQNPRHLLDLGDKYPVVREALERVDSGERIIL